MLDLSGVTFMDSSGLRVLIEHVGISAVGDRLRLHASSNVLDLMETAGLSGRFALVTLDELPDTELAAEG